MEIKTTFLRSLIEAVKAGDKEKVNTLLEADTEVNVRDK